MRKNGDATSFPRCLAFSIRKSDEEWVITHEGSSPLRLTLPFTVSKPQSPKNLLELIPGSGDLQRIRRWRQLSTSCQELIIMFRSRRPYDDAKAFIGRVRSSHVVCYALPESTTLLIYDDLSIGYHSLQPYRMRILKFNASRNCSHD